MQVAGKSLGSIYDIVRTATGSDFPEIPKHSIMLYERFTDSGGTRYQPRIFTVSPDGSVRKQHELEGYNVNGQSTESPREQLVQRMSLAISDKRFGQRRTVMYTTPGMHDPTAGYEYNVYGFRTIESNGTEDSANISDVPKTNSERMTLYGAGRQIWGNAHMTVRGMEDKDVFVCLHSTLLAQTGDLYFRFFTSDRNETGNVDWHDINVQGGDDKGWKLRDFGDGIRGVGVAAGDFDGDGYKNEIAVCFNENYNVCTYFYRLNFANGQASIHQIHNVIIHHANVPYGDRVLWGIQHDRQATPNVVTGDFDGDGCDEAAFVNKMFVAIPNANQVETQMRVTIIKYRNNTGAWDMGSVNILGDSACKVTKCDFDGDGKDELAILFFQPNNGALYPRLERCYCNSGQIQPIRDTNTLKGGSNTSVLGYWVAGNEYNQYYKIAEDFNMTAGPVLRTKGKVKLAEDVVISHVNSDASRVFIIPTNLDDSQNFAGFGDTKTIYNVVGTDSSRRGAVITGDFANERLMLGEPIHSYDDEDMSYVTILQAMPYHVDNVDTNGNLVPYMINYTCSAFKGDVDTNGEMSVSYTRVDDNTTKNDITFSMASTTETIALLGDADPYVHDYLKFKTMGANIAGNFDQRAKAAADTMNTIMDFVTDKIDTTTTNSTSSVKGKQTTQVEEALIWDKVVSYSSGQHIWRYKILNNPLPSWYKLGLKADNRSKDLKAESEERYLSFSMYDDVTRKDTDSASTNTYQARHEEGNFFSYPSVVEQIEGYTDKGALVERQWVAWSKGSSTGKNIQFTNANTASNSYEENIKESEMNKTVSAIASFFGADDPNPLPPYTGHSETFTKTLSTAEAISIKLYGKSTIPGEDAGHMIMSMPFVAREGTLKVGHAVQLLENAQSRLWASGGRYKTYADPSLVLPHKFTRSGSNLVADKNNFSAMQMRGLRFYVPDTDQYSDTHLVAGLTYEIRVPIYNASFVTAHNVKVKLSYIKNTDFKGLRFNETVDQLKTTMNSLKEIGTETVTTLGGWPDNKKWVTFKWTVPQDAENAEYVLFAQIDPAGGITEGHESRLNYSTGDIVDVGGNNEGYFVFNITSMAEARRKHAKAAAIMAGELKPGHSDGVVYGAFYQKGVGAIGGGNIKAASNTLDRTGNISADVKLVGLEESGAPIDTVDFMMLLGILSEMADVSEDAIAQMEFSVTYDGDEYYPEVYLQGVNFKDGVRDQVEERGYPVRDEIESMFAVHRMALVPHTTTHFTMTLTPRAIGFENGAGFEFYVPELAAASVYEEIANSQEEKDSDTDTDTDPEPSDDPSVDPDTPTSTLGSSGGGCEVFGGSFALLGLAGMALLKQRKHR